ncbi:hypothetical protein [Demequina capsici]|uniref:Uncharacterized protein n=1 Tax=Demequina capsici TaxID=3075620 RepID=A0AA96F929_9MICO|nr:hypothetical protein [Demequina sp. OYTSA14]WNM25779.1 hypothetical protein RN606_06415 [Demequina sp. OYTSA14]
MKRANTDITVGTLFIVLLLAIGAWFLLFSPSLDARAEAIDQTAAANDQNDLLQTQLDGLLADYARLDEINAGLDAVHVDLPVREDLESVRSTINDTANAYGITIVDLTAGAPYNVDPSTLVLADAAAAVGKESTVDGLTFTSLVATPMQLTVEGSYTKVLGALTDLQLGDHRFVYVATSEIKETEVGSGVYDGTFSLDVFTYVTADVDPTLPESLVDSTETPSSANPFTGTAGTE